MTRMATQHDENTAPVTDSVSESTEDVDQTVGASVVRPAGHRGTVPVGERDTRGFGTVLLYGIAAFALFAVLFLIIDLLTGHL